MLTELDKALDATIAAITGEGGQLPVAKGVVRGVEMPVFVAGPPTMREFVEAFGALNGAKEFVVYREERYTLGEIVAQGKRIAAACQARYGLAKGDRVAIAMRNYPEWIAAVLGLLHFGVVVVPMNAWWQADEFAYGLKDCGARLVLADGERAKRLVGTGVPIVTVRCDEALGDARLEDLLDGGPAEAWQPPVLVPGDDAWILYTSGSTGYPKGAVSTHQALVAGALNYVTTMLAMLHLHVQAGNTPAEQQVMLLNVPLFHVTGAVPIFLVSFVIGRKLVIMHRWDAGEALRLMEEEKATYFVGVPTMSLELMQHPDRPNYKLEHLVDIAAGGAPRPEAHVERLAEAFPGKNPALGYGLTETNAVGAGNLRSNYRAKPNSTGRASGPVVEIDVADENGTPLPPGQVGAIRIRSVANARGYWNKPAETAKAFMAGGWFDTGDIGYLDEDGYVFIVDRAKDIIIRGGENISCQEVEAAIYAHPDVAEAAVFGLPDERLGEITGAVVHPKAGARLSGEDVIDFTKAKLASFKVPARVWIDAEQLPKLGSGKIDKVTLRAAYREKA